MSLLKKTNLVSMTSVAVLTTVIAVGCSNQQADPAATTPANTGPLELSIAMPQVGEIPAKGNEVELAIEKYTNSKLNIQWIPLANYDEKINVMIASNELPKILKVNYTPVIRSDIQQNMFWEVGPLLNNYKNLKVQNPQYYANIMVDGKLYGVPNYREIGRSAIVYRKDWLDKLGLKTPKTLDDWYNVAKAITLNDPDGNSKNDTYGFVLDKKYNINLNATSILTRMAVSQGGVNTWGVDSSGKFTPEFMTQPFMDTMKLFKRMYAEKLINQDFTSLESADGDNQFEKGRVGIKVNGSATNAANIQDRLKKVVPTAELDIVNWEGTAGPRVAGQPGNNGLLVFPKSSVKNEAELKRILTFLDQLLDEPMSTLQKRGIEGKHFKRNSDGTVEWLDLTAFNREVKPYRDDLVNFETYNVPQLKDTPLAMKGYQMEPAGLKFSIPNPALTLNSTTYNDHGAELDQMIQDAETKYIIGKIDDAGFQSEVDRWLKAGGDKVIKEFQDSYAALNKK
ncbi:extracellular solute-binding protein [Paenibacillus aceris]|uniref:extracellular solute-binding protein n=1 Tax=Paenibacillus aceris TaxID=869555 RepID=UPI0018777F87|nr:extracellular solute-binding protein [Paenibacillus aceris]